MNILDSLGHWVPELILIGTLLAVLLADILSMEERGFDIPALIAFYGSIFAFASHVYLYALPEATLFSGMIVHDPLGTFFRGFFLLTTMIVIGLSIYNREIMSYMKSEYYAILLSSTLGMCLVAMSHDLLMAYLALELMSIGSYILAGFARRSTYSAEAALKYVLYGGVSTGIMLFGLTFLFGLTGSTDFTVIQAALAEMDQTYSVVLYAILAMMMVGVGYKIAMIPFHFWAPDVYQGAPLLVTAFLSVASKAAGFAFLIRVGYSLFLVPSGDTYSLIPAVNADWTLHFAILAALTMTIGNVAAYPQTNIKRLLAYSGIAHAGYLLMGIALLTVDGLEAILLYLIVYLITNLAAFLVLMCVVESGGDERLSGIRGLWKSAPLAAVVMCLAMFSLVGLPPTAGFVGKLVLFLEVIDSGLMWLAVVGVVNSVVSLYYYARIMKAMFFEASDNPTPIQVHPVYSIWLALFGFSLLYFGLFWNPLIGFVSQCTGMLR